MCELPFTEFMFYISYGASIGSVGKESAYDARDTGDMGAILGWEDPLEGEMATHSSIFAWEISLAEEPVGYSPWGHKRSDTTEWLSIYTHVLHAGYIISKIFLYYWIFIR